MPSPQRYALLSANRSLLPIALLCAGALIALSGALWLRLSAAAAAVLLVGLQAWARRRRPVLVLDDSGYAVEVAGSRRFFVPWTAVTRVLHDPSEQALYLDCGEPGHNLLLPPRAGFAFTFTDRQDLYQRLLSQVGERAQLVERLDQPSTTPPSG